MAQGFLLHLRDPVWLCHADPEARGSPGTETALAPGAAYSLISWAVSKWFVSI